MYRNYGRLACISAVLMIFSHTLAARETAGFLTYDDKEIAWRQAEQKRLEQLTDDELITQISKIKIEWHLSFHGKKIHSEMLLTEMIRRGGKEMEKAIVEKMQKQRAGLHEESERERKENEDKAKGIKVKAVEREYASSENLPMLTALRRIQKKPDPVEICVKQLGMVSTTRELPCFSVVLKNVDVEKQPFHFASGGDYRSGRLARWTFEVRDARGNLLPPRHWEASMGGGMFSAGDMEHGKTWNTELPLNSYVKITEPGEYTMRVLYHNSHQLADYPDRTGVIFCASTPFKVSVGKPVPRKVFVQDGSDKKVASIVQNIKGSTVRTVCSKYDKDLYSFIDPTSPEGQLLQMEWNAVPGLLDLLKDQNMTPEQRAWIFTMLHTLTGTDGMSPFSRRLSSRFNLRGGVIGDYEYRGVGCYGSGGGTINPEVQQKFAEEWLKLAPELWVFVVADDATLKDWANLEGDWKMVSGTANGTAIKIESRAHAANGEIIQHTYSAQDQQNMTYFQKPYEVLKAKYLIDGVKKTIDYDITQGAHQGKKQLGIYRLEGNTITFCFAAPGQARPSEFSSKPGREWTLSEWKRGR